MADQLRTGFVIDANENPFRAAMQRLANSARDGQRGVVAAFSGMQARFVAVAAGAATVVSGMAALTMGVVNAANDLQDLSDKTGVTVENLVGLRHAAEFSGSSSEMLDTAMKALNKSISEAGMGSKTISSWFSQLGIAVRGANGELKSADQVMRELAAVFPRLSAADRVAVSMALLGKSGSDLAPMLAGGREALESLIEEGQRLTPITAELAEQSAILNDKFKVMGITVRQGVYPAVSDLLPTISAIADEMARASGTGSAFDLIGKALRITLEAVTVTAMEVVYVFKSIGTEVSGIARQLVALAKLDFNGFSEIGKQMREDAALARAEQDAAIDRIMNPKPVAPPPPPKPPSASPTSPPIRLKDPSATDKEGKASKEKEPTFMSTYELALQYRKLTYEKENTLREFSKEQELQYWQDIQEAYQLTSKDRTAVAMKVAKLEIEIMRDKARQQQEIDALHMDDVRAQSLDYIDELQARVQAEVDLRTSTEAEYLAQARAFNQQRLAVELEYIDAKIKQAETDPDKNLVLLEQLEMQKLEIKRRFAAQDSELIRAQTQERNKEVLSTASTVESSWANLINSLAQGSITVGGFIKGLFTSVVDAVIGTLAQMAAQWLVQQIMQRVIGKTTAASQIAANAGVAGSAAVASAAAIPLYGWAMAPAAGAAAFSAAMGFMAPAMASAAGGFDIPSGLNPITQLHEEEMVLPKDIANPLRESLRQGGGGGGAGGGTGEIVGMPAEQWLMVNRKSLVKALNASGRDFRFVLGRK